MTINKTEALVLGSINLIGADKIICLYSPEYGQIRGVAHGIKRIKNRFGSSLEPLTQILLVFKFKPDRELQLIQQADIINTNKEIRNDIICLSAGLYLAELIQKLTPVGAPGQSSIYQLILKSLELLSNKSDILSIIRIFEIRLLDLLGYRPHLENCLNCATELLGHKWWYSPSMGGILCESCKTKCRDLFSISPGEIKFLRKALDINLGMIGRLRIMPSSKKDIERLLQSTIFQYLASPVKSYSVFLRLLDEQ